jgi:hypothetical protein
MKDKPEAPATPIKQQPPPGYQWGSVAERVWCTYDEKVQFVQYTTTGVGFGMSSDVREGETPVQAMGRCFRHVQSMVNYTLEKLEAERGK